MTTATRSYMISENYCDNWSVVDAIREIIANAQDTAKITGEHIQIEYVGGVGYVKNSQTCLEKRFLLIGESASRKNTDTTGQFGEGFKIAALILCRLGREFAIHSGKYDFVYSVEQDKEMNARQLIVNIKEGAESNTTSVGTECSFDCSEEEFSLAKELFVNLVPRRVIDNEIIDSPGDIYVTGVKVASDYGTIFGYNLTNKKMINRDRTILDKEKLSEAIRQAISSSSCEEVIKTYIETAIENPSLEHTLYLWHGNKALWLKVLTEKFGKKLCITSNDPKTDSVAQYKGYTVLSLGSHVNYSIQQITSIVNAKEVKLASVRKMENPNPEEIKMIDRAKYYIINKLKIMVGNVYLSDELEDHIKAQHQGNDIYLNRKYVTNFPTVFRSILHENAHIDSKSEDCTSVFESKLCDYLESVAKNLWDK